MDYGNDPARYKWNYVNLSHYKLIYPQGMDSMAYKYALYLENIFPKVQKTIRMPRKHTFPVVLHPGNMQSNGMVSWAPRRMELITTPSAKIEAQAWDKHLVMHESRHVIQTSKLMTGIFRPLYFLIGEQAAGLTSLFATQWFFEGDAVGAETAMSNSGRGRLPEFHMTYRAQMLSDEAFSFDKWYLGSYKDYTGDFYALGYNMTSYAKYAYGADIWDRITSRYVSRFLHLPPFVKAIKYHTGGNVDDLFQQTFSFLQEEWERQDKTYQTPAYLSPSSTHYTSYRYPQPCNDSTVIAVRSGLHDINALVSLTGGKEKLLYYLGILNSRIQLQGDHIYWSETIAGSRWTHENYSVIKRYNLQTGKTDILTPQGRYLSPAVDRAGRVIAASQPRPDGENRIVLIDTDNGKEMASFTLPDNAFAKEITFGEQGQVIVLAVGDKGLSIQQLDTHLGKWTELLPPTPINLTSLYWHNGLLYFESGLNGTNNIYCLHTGDKEIRRVTTARFGAFQPTLSSDGKQLLFADYQAKGYKIASLPVDSLIPEKTDFTEPYRFALAETLARQESYNIDTATLKPIAFNPKPYRKAAHLFNIHSWAPLYYDVADIMNFSGDDLTTIVKPGITLLSQNTLNTAITQAGWYYKNGYHHGKISFSYSGWYPVIDLKMDYGSKAFDLLWVKNNEGKETTHTHVTGRNRWEAEARIYIPFNLTKNHYIRGIQPSVTYYYSNNRYQQHDSKKIEDFQYILSELRFYNYRRMAKRDILPKWGYQVRLQHLATPFNGENFGNLYAARLTTYWPGLMQNHSLMLRLGYQYQNIDKKWMYMPKRLLEAARGYGYLYQTRQQVAFKADYAFTIASPDWKLGSLLYLQRIRSNLFYDLTRNEAGKNSQWGTQSAAGADLIFDLNVIRMSYPISIGARFIQPIDYGNFQAEALFSVSF
ncbi:WD40 repeat domain-containing protein [Parabacteroides sp. OttesenSCG-928-G06]|nr:WD40 repeat domain-containing protein [Parabacteroides sp. OttesenSCG-928-G06]